LRLGIDKNSVEAVTRQQRRKLRFISVPSASRIVEYFGAKKSFDADLYKIMALLFLVGLIHRLCGFHRFFKIKSAQSVKSVDRFLLFPVENGRLK
jgi:hypothetical protein